MNVTDLMVGDWVICNIGNTKEQVCEIYETQVMLFYNNIYDYDEITPIPLTTEILEKNGFKSYSHESNLICGINLQGSNIILSYMDYDWLIVIDSVNLKRLRAKYVHELQHVFKLFKISKEIIL